MSGLTDETEKDLDTLLSRWHTWKSKGGGTNGYYGTSPGFEQWRCSRQYDSDNGAADEDAEDAEMNALDFVIGRLSSVHQTAIQINARNLCTGYYCWASARLPADPLARAHVVAEARVALVAALAAPAGW